MLEAAAGEVAAALGAASPLLMRASDGRSGAGLRRSIRRTPTALAAAAEVAAAGLQRRDRRLRARAPRASASRTCRPARRCARPTAGSSRSPCVALASALLADPDGSPALRVRRTRAARRDTEAAAGLRETLEAYLAEGASHKRASLRLAVHEKTVVHRVRRAEELLGRPLTGRRAAVEAALVVRRLLPPD